MNFFKRAIISITRKPGKTAILLSLVFILGNLVAGSFSIEQSVKNAQSAVLGEIVPLLTLQQNWELVNQLVEEKMAESGIEEPNYSDPNFDFESFDWDEYNERRNEIWQEVTLGGEHLTSDLIEELGALPTVVFYDYSASAGLTSKEIKKYYTPEYENSNNFYAPPEGESDYFNLHGSMSGDILDIKMGLIELVDGDTLSDSKPTAGDYEVLVSKQFAEKNSLQVGSTFSLENEIFVYQKFDDEFAEEDVVSIARGGSRIIHEYAAGDGEYTGPEVADTLEFDFTVVGIYEPNIPPAAPDADEWNTVYMEVERRNRIYTLNNAIKEINEFIFTENKHYNPDDYAGLDEPQEYLQPIFAFQNNEGLNQFADTIEEMFGEYYWIIDNELDYDGIVTPLKNMSLLANIILYEGIGASLIILSLLVTLFLRDRRGEIGTYLALGERKRRIVAQVLVEVMLVSVIGITASLFTGNALSSQLSNSMIDRQVQSQQERENNRRNAPPTYNYESNTLKQAGYGAEITLEKLADNYKVTLGKNIIIIFYAGGIMTVLLSTLIPIMYVLRLNPRKILM
ncbi:MAG: ABC transporter permease [Oscillospiraceae bacterium]|nr:ABC transporter permease [Oscillospiraceae bacterium]